MSCAHGSRQVAGYRIGGAAKVSIHFPGVGSIPIGSDGFIVLHAAADGTGTLVPWSDLCKGHIIVIFRDDGPVCLALQPH